jgi:4-amino-4-deoxychorismate lyase
MLFESIRCEHGRLEQLGFHRERMERSRWALFGIAGALDLSAAVQTAASCNGVHKCRVVYAHDIASIECSPYAPRVPGTIALVADDTIAYEHKFVDRAALQALVASRPDADDVIIVRHGLLTDASYANIALFDGTRWETPARPLLRGTRRERLLREGLLVEREIRPADLMAYERISLINAMLDMGEAVLPVSRVLPL